MHNLKSTKRYFESETERKTERKGQRIRDRDTAREIEERE